MTVSLAPARRRYAVTLDGKAFASSSFYLAAEAYAVWSLGVRAQELGALCRIELVDTQRPT